MPWPWRKPNRPNPSAPRAEPPLFHPEFLRKLDRVQLVVPRPTALREGAQRARGALAPYGFEVHGFRPYTWGDDLRYLDWNAYARTDELLLRVFRAERESATYLLLDTSASMDVSVRSGVSAFSFSRQLIASLAYICLRRHEPVMIGLLGGGASSCRRSPVWRHRRQTLEAARFVEAVRPSGRVDLRSALESFLSQPLVPGVSIVLSDFYYPVEEVSRALALLAARRLAVVALQILPRSHFEWDWPSGVLTVRDAETNEERTLAWDSATRARYREALAHHQAELRDSCHRHGFYYVHVDPDAGLDSCLFGALVHAGIVG